MIVRVRKNFGYIRDVVELKHWTHFGCTGVFSAVALNPSGDWSKYLPPAETQKKNNVETYNCATFGTLHCLQALYKLVFGMPVNYSDRQLGIAAGTIPYRGNSLQKVADTIKNTGVVDENVLPFSDDITTIEQYYQPKPLPDSVIATAKQWANKYLFAHEWAFRGGSIKSKQAAIKSLLTKSPLAISVQAWNYDTDTGLYFKDLDIPDNHIVMLYGYVEGKYWNIFDTYDNYCKRLEWDYNFGCAKVFYLSARLPDATSSFVMIKQQSSIVFLILDKMAQILNLMKLEALSGYVQRFADTIAAGKKW